MWPQMCVEEPPPFLAIKPPPLSRTFVFDCSRLLDQIGLMTWCSTLKMTAVMITAARVALGMKAQYGMRKARQRMTTRPV